MLKLLPVAALRQKLAHRFRRLWRSEVKALGDVAIDCAEGRELLLGLDALRHDRHAEVVSLSLIHI